MKVGKRIPIVIPPGVNKDDNAYTSLSWSDANRIRFYRSYPQLIGGNKLVPPQNTMTLTGVPRSIYSYIDNNNLEHLLIGTSTRLYSYESNNLYNITPLLNSITNIANSLATNYGTFSNNPIGTTVNTLTITVTFAPFAAGLFKVGDIVSISGATDTGGIVAANINGTRTITAVSGTTFTFVSDSPTVATGTATGGGASVILATRVITVTHNAHKFINGDVIRILNAQSFGGFVANDLNLTATARNVTTNTYDYYSSYADQFSKDFATSSVSGMGGTGAQDLGPSKIILGTDTLASNYNTLANNPINVTSGSQVVVITYSPFTQGTFQENDVVDISGATAVGGLTVSGTYAIYNVTGTTFSITLGSAANSSTSGGGNAVILATKVITVTHAAHGFIEGDRVKIDGATLFAGFSAADLNVEANVRNVTTNTYDYYLSASADYATSSASGGGAAISEQPQIAAGICAYSSANGYGGGGYGYNSNPPLNKNYGPGFPFLDGSGNPLGYEFPQIWSFDILNGYAVLTPGSQGGLYVWDGNLAIAPTLAPNSPTAINYVFVGANQVITFGANDVPYQIQTSDTNSYSTWRIDATTNAFSAPVDNMGILISSGFCKNQYLIFSQNRVAKMIYVGKPNIWIVQDLLPSDGVISPRSVVSFNDTVIWHGLNNLYFYNGSIVSILPDNGLKEWWFNSINQNRAYHGFIYKPADFNEVWFFAALNNADECNSYIIFNWEEGHYTNGMMSRTASEYPTNLSRPQYMAVGDCSGTPTSALYQHDLDDNYSDNGVNQVGSLTSNSALIGEGDYMQQIYRIVPSNVILSPIANDQQSLLYTMTILTKEYDGQTLERSFGPYNVYNNSTKVEVRANGRQRQYVFNFSTQVGFRMEKFYEEIQAMTVR